MTVKTCPDCDAPVADDMWPTDLHGCWYWLQRAERMRREGRSEDDIAAMYRSGADAPCVGNHYDYVHSRDSKERAGVVATLGVVIALVCVAVLYWCW